jgi:multidrug resistance efflux pump
MTPPARPLNKVAPMPHLREEPQTAAQQTAAPPLPASVPRTIFFIALALTGGLGVTHLMSPENGPAFPGRLEAATSTVCATTNARVAEILVPTGEELSLGQPLIRLEVEDLEARLARGRQDLARLESELEQARARAGVEMSWRAKQLDSEIVATQLKSASYLKEQFAQKLARTAWDGFLEHYNDRIASDVANDEVFQSVVYNAPILSSEQRIRALLQRQVAENASEVYEAQIAICEKRLEELESLKEQLPEQIRLANGVDVAEARLAEARAELARMEARKESLTLKVARHGTVGVWRAQPGAFVAPGDPVVDLFDDEKRFVTVRVPSVEVTQFHAGERVQLEFPGGVLREGTVEALPPQTAHVAAEADGSTSVEVRVVPIGKLWPHLPLGSDVAVRVGGEWR